MIRYKKAKAKKKIRPKMVMAFVIFHIALSIVLAPLVLFWGPFQALKVVAVGSVYTSRHPQVVKAFLTEEEINTILSSYNSGNTGLTPVKRQQVQTGDPAAGVVIEDIQGHGFKGKVMLVKNPQRVKVAVTKDIGVQGEWLSSMVKDAGAIGGINAGGFYDPDGKGNGSFPAGITVHEGTVVHNNAGEQRPVLSA